MCGVAVYVDHSDRHLTYRKVEAGRVRFQMHKQCPCRFACSLSRQGGEGLYAPQGHESHDSSTG